LLCAVQPQDRVHNRDCGGSEPKLTHGSEILHEWNKITLVEVQFHSKKWTWR
jgi:hypothetical protein